MSAAACPNIDFSVIYRLYRLKFGYPQKYDWNILSENIRTDHADILDRYHGMVWYANRNPPLPGIPSRASGSRERADTKQKDRQ